MEDNKLQILKITKVRKQVENMVVNLVNDKNDDYNNISIKYSKNLNKGDFVLDLDGNQKNIIVPSNENLQYYSIGQVRVVEEVKEEVVEGNDGEQDKLYSVKFKNHTGMVDVLDGVKAGNKVLCCLASSIVQSKALRFAKNISKTGYKWVQLKKYFSQNDKIIELSNNKDYKDGELVVMVSIDNKSKFIKIPKAFFPKLYSIYNYDFEDGYQSSDDENDETRNIQLTSQDNKEKLESEKLVNLEKIMNKKQQQKKQEAFAKLRKKNKTEKALAELQKKLAGLMKKKTAEALVKKFMEKLEKKFVNNCTEQGKHLLNKLKELEKREKADALVKKVVELEKKKKTEWFEGFKELAENKKKADALVKKFMEKLAENRKTKAFQGFKELVEKNWKSNSFEMSEKIEKPKLVTWKYDNDSKTFKYDSSNNKFTIQEFEFDFDKGNGFKIKIKYDVRVGFRRFILNQNKKCVYTEFFEKSKENKDVFVYRKDISGVGDQKLYGEYLQTLNDSNKKKAVKVGKNEQFLVKFDRNKAEQVDDIVKVNFYKTETKEVEEMSNIEENKDTVTENQLIQINFEGETPVDSYDLAEVDYDSLSSQISM
ncbi:MAG: hypothetical protein AAFO15_01360 [Pseudomonadota bacterium]